jgi:hypothetical protein
LALLIVRLIRAVIVRADDWLALGALNFGKPL